MSCNYEALRGYVESGKTNKEIADLEGVSLSLVEHWIRRNGLKGIRKKGRKFEVKEEIRHREAVPDFKPGYNADRYWCRSCQYRAKIKGCDYYMITNEERICDPGDCDKYVKGPRLIKE